MLYTAQFRYSGRDRLDITVKSTCVAGKFFAPTWDMVMGYKRGIIDAEEYSRQYFALLTERWHRSEDFRTTATNLPRIVQDRDMTLVCYCPAGEFCHRILLAKWFAHNWPVAYAGERDLRPGTGEKPA